MRMLDLISPRTDLTAENRTSRVHKEEQERKVVRGFHHPHKKKGVSLEKIQG
jgi:hypothetical protein